MVFIGLLISGTAATLAVILGFVAFCSYRGTVLTTVISWIAAIAAISTAALSHTFANKLANYSSKAKLPGTSKIVTKLGHTYLSTVWAAATFSLSAALLWSFITWRKRAARTKKASTKHYAANRKTSKKIPFIGVMRRATGGLLGGKAGRDTTSYKHFGGGQEMVGMSSQNSSHNDLLSHSRARSQDHSRPGSRLGSRSRAGSRGRAGSNEHGEILYDSGQILQTNTAYEPLRHHQVPE